MKKIVGVFLLMMGLAGISLAESHTVLVSSAMANGVVVATQSWVVDLDAIDANAISVQLYVSSGIKQGVLNNTVSSVTFQDGRLSTGTFTFPSTLTDLTTAYATNKITVAATSQLAGANASAYITVMSTTGMSGHYVTIAGYQYTAGTDFQFDGCTTSDTAKYLSDAIRGHPSVFVSSMSLGTSVVYATATVIGEPGNTIQLASSNTTYLKLGASTATATTFTGGSNPAFVGQKLYVNGSTLPIDSLQAATSSDTAIALCSFMNYVGTGVFVSTVSVGTSVIYSTMINYGTVWNNYALSSSTSALTIASTTFYGGRDNAYITINGYKISVNTDFYLTDVASTTMARCVTAINDASSPIKNIVRVTSGTPPSRIMYATSTYTGSWTMFPITASTYTVGSYITVSSSILLGGVDSDVIYSTDPVDRNIGEVNGYFGDPYNNKYPRSSIIKSSATTGWGTATAVWFSSSSTSTPYQLRNGSTYYISNLSANSFQLSDTSTGALAGLYITLSTGTPTSGTSILGGNTFAVTPSTFGILGAAVFQLQESNDGINYSVLTSTTNTWSFATPYNTTNVMSDIGNVYFRFLKFVYNAPTLGGVYLKWILNGKRL